MKKNIILAVFAAAAALLVSTSCTKQDDFQAVSGAKVFTASIEQVQTKTSLGAYAGKENVIFWDKRDSILINKETFYSAEPNSEKPMLAEFLHCGGPEPKAPYEAIFPASLYVDNDYLQAYCFPQVQTYRAGKFNAPMYAYDENRHLMFNNICGVICFSLKGTEKIRSIELTSKTKYINGVFKIVEESKEDYTAVIDVTAGEFYGYNRTVTLDCGENGVQLSKTDSTNFFIYLPETSFAAGDLSVRVTTAEGKSVEKTAANAVDVKKNTVYTFNWEVDATLKNTLANFFKGLSEDQARLAAATDEAMSDALIEQYKNNPQKLFLPEIHTWSNARPAILEIEKSIAKIDNNVVNLIGLTKPELLFLESYLYFELARTYGQAPPILSLPGENDPLTEFIEFIVNNAERAINLELPEKYDPDKRTIELAEGIEMTRPTRWAAEALMGRTCLYAISRLFNYMNSFRETANKFLKDIIDNGGFALESDYSDLWGEKAFDNKELIFGVRLAQNDAYKGIHPTLWLVNQFEENDCRKECTFGNDESGLTIIKKPVSQIIPVFRYADILLMCSESTEDVQYENKVLVRVGGEPRASYSLSYIIEDRMKELAFEGHRFWDVRRWQEGGNCFGVKFGLTWSENYNFYPTPW